MLIIRILRSKHRRTNRTCEMFDMVFLVARSDIGSPECLVALPANEVESCKVVSLTQGIRAVLIVHGEEFGSDNLITVLERQGAATISLLS